MRDKMDYFIEILFRLSLYMGVGWVLPISGYIWLRDRFYPPIPSGGFMLGGDSLEILLYVIWLGLATTALFLILLFYLNLTTWLLMFAIYVIWSLISYYFTKIF